MADSLMKVLATGLTGFVGKNVLRKLVSDQRDIEVIALSSGDIPSIRTIPSQGYDFGEGYLIDNGCQDVEIVLHLGHSSRRFLPMRTTSTPLSRTSIVRRRS